MRGIGNDNPNLIVLDGDLGNSTRANYFRDEFPDRFFNFGIAESNLIRVSSGLWASGKDVLVASFACLLLCNAYDQIRMSIAFPKANVKLVGSHSGISIGEDGPSQMGIEDTARATEGAHRLRRRLRFRDRASEPASRRCRCHDHRLRPDGCRSP